MKSISKHKQGRKFNLQEKLLLGFHTQFAENQRTREQSFLKILGFLGAVIFGYAYVYHNYNAIQPKEFSYITLVSEFLLSFGTLIITIIAYNFRRDQIINAKIRTKVNLLGDDNIFPRSFDPRLSSSLSRPFGWMPDFLNLFFYLFPVVQIILLVSYFDKQKSRFDFCNPELGITLVNMLCIFAIIFMHLL